MSKNQSIVAKQKCYDILFSLFMGSPFFTKRVSNVLLRNFCGQKEKEGLEDNSVPILDNLVER